MRICIGRVEARGHFELAQGRLILAASPQSQTQPAVGHLEFRLEVDRLTKRRFCACRVMARQQVETPVYCLGDSRQGLDGGRQGGLLRSGNRHSA
jgi:hypothetical protein